MYIHTCIQCPARLRALSVSVYRLRILFALLSSFFDAGTLRSLSYFPSAARTLMPEGAGME